MTTHCSREAIKTIDGGRRSSTKPRWCQFSLRALLLFVLIVGLSIGWMHALASQYEEELRAASELSTATGLEVTRDRSGGSMMRRLFSAVSGKDYSAAVGLGPPLTTRYVGMSTRYSRIDKHNFAAVRHLRNLQRLELQCNEVDDEALEHIGQLSSIEFIWLHGDSVTGRAFRHWKGLSRLRDLYLEKTSVDDTALGYLGTVKSLDGLLLGGRITDNGLEHLSAFPNLRRLLLYDLPITDDGLLALRQLTSLRELSLVENTRITRRGIDGLRKARPDLTISADGL